jgi:hypothetical protein
VRFERRAVDATGEIVIVGIPGEADADFGTGPLTLSGTAAHAVLAGYDYAEHARFVDVFDGTQITVGDLALSPNGTLTVAGSFVGATDFAGQLISAPTTQVFLASFDWLGPGLSART